MGSYGSATLGKGFHRFSTALFLWALAASLCYADSRRVIEYEYDASGNLVRIESEVGDQPPQVTGLTPSEIRIGPTVAVLAQGTGVLNAMVRADDPGLSITNVGGTSTAVTFDLTAGAGVPIGAHTLTFTTALGSDAATITVRPPLPVIQVAPAPVVLPSNGTPVPVDVRLSSVDVVDHTIALATSDPSIATVQPASITIPAGQLRSPDSVLMSGSTIGTTRLALGSGTLAGFSVSVFVTAPFVPAPGGQVLFSRPLGLVLQRGAAPPELFIRGPFSAELSVRKESSTIPSPSAITPLASPRVGVVLGPAITGVSPATLLVGSGPIDLTISGSGLLAVTDVEVIPSEGIALGFPTPSGDGRTVTLAVTVASDAVIGVRQVVVSASGERILPASAGADRIRIAAGPPEIFSISPTVVTRSTVTPLSVRGVNLAVPEAVTVTPAEGVILGANPSVNAAGTELTIGLSVSDAAPLGDRVVRVVTGAGASSATASPANTLSIVDGPITGLMPIVAPPVGVSKGTITPPPPELGMLRAPAVGVAVGSVFTGLDPSTAIIDTDLVLRIRGSGLEHVTSVSFRPATGLSTGTLFVDPAGEFVEVPVTIAPDAPQTVRTVIVAATGQAIAASPASAAQFLITGPQPVIDFVSPNFLVRGAPAATITVGGVFFDLAQSVQVLPPQGISVSPPVVSATGTSLTVNMSATADASPGARLVVVQTPAGQTATTATPANTLNVVSQVVQVLDRIVAPALGVVKEQPPATTPDPLSIAAPLLGVEVQTSTPPREQIIGLQGPPLGVTLGPVAFRIAPTAIPIDTTASLIIEGHALEGVTAIDLVPEDGITQDGAFTVSADGRQITVPISVSASAPQTVRRVVLRTATGVLAFSDPSGDRLRIAGTLPTIESIDPIQQFQGSTFVLTVRGFNLRDALSVDFTPPAGISVSPPSANAPGTELTVQVSVSAAATPGARVVTVTSPAGTTSSEATAANTFTVIAP